MASGTLAPQNSAWLAAMELATLSLLPMALKAALNLNVPEILASADVESQLSAAEIVDRIPTSNPGAAASFLDRILRVLASHSVLSSSLSLDDSGTPVRKYGLTPTSKYLVKDRSGVSLVETVLLFQGKVFADTWHHLHEAVLDGSEPFTKAHGMKLFPYGQIDSTFDKLFNAAMGNHTTLFMEGLMETYDGFGGLGTLVDVGGGTGSCLQLITSKHPHIRGINFDQPHVIATAPACEGVEHVAGDMFDSVPSGDAIFMKWIVHDWSDEKCVKLLRNCYEALPEGGKVIVVDIVLSAAVEHGVTARVASHFDLMMMAYTSGGKERTEEEFRELAMASHFARCKIVCTYNEFYVIEFYKS